MHRFLNTTCVVIGLLFLLVWLIYPENVFTLLLSGTGIYFGIADYLWGIKR